MSKSLKACEGVMDNKDQPKDVPNAKTGGYPVTGVKTSGIQKRGTGAQTKAKTMRGPVA
jgi:hypothetical protein